MREMLHIDGSYGEGGGQIVRTAAALSVLTQTPIQITNIRANRPIIGLRPQHYTALCCLQKISNADVKGLSVHSTAIEFIPHEITPGDYCFDVGTAGSMILVFQACLLSALKTTAPLTIKLRGGTDVRWAPSWDYFTCVFLPLLEKIGIKTDVALLKRGYYPTGGGEATLTIHPIEKLRLFHVEEPQEFHEIKGIIHRANLPEHISTRMKHAAIKIATKHHLSSSIQVQEATSSSPGTGITLWCTSEHTILGSTTLGERNIPAETVGATAANHLIREIQSQATVDAYAIDQILPYFTLLPRGSCCVVREVSSHTKTNMWVIKQFGEIDFQLTPQQHLMRITII